MNVVCYDGGWLWMWSVIKWPVMKAVCNEQVCYECGLLQTWSAMNLMCNEWVCYECGLQWMRSVMNVVCCERGQLRTWFVVTVLCNQRVGNERVCVMNVVCYECGVLWMWCVMVCGVSWFFMKKASYERGLLSTFSVMNGFIMNVVYYDVWSIMKCGLLWPGL